VLASGRQAIQTGVTEHVPGRIVSVCSADPTGAWHITRPLTARYGDERVGPTDGR